MAMPAAAAAQREGKVSEGDQQGMAGVVLGKVRAWSEVAKNKIKRK